MRNGTTSKAGFAASQAAGRRAGRALRWGVALLALPWLFAAAPGAAQTVPTYIAYDGFLSDAAGTGLTLDVDLTFFLYDRALGGEPLWSETHTGVAVVAGRFTVRLGSRTALEPALLRHPAMWLGISVGAAAEGTPRQRIISGPAAFRAISTERLGGAGLADLVPQAGPVPGAFVRGKVAQGRDALAIGGLSYDELDDTDELAYALAHTPSHPLSVDGLGGGRVNGDVTVVGALRVSGAIQVGAATACVAGEPCGPPITSISCAAGQVLVSDGAGGWRCRTTLPAPLAACNDFFHAIRWDGQAWVCADLLGEGPSAGRALGFERVDQWGFGWDGLMRRAATFNAARVQCEQVGGRLPTVTELHRINALDGAGGIGDSNDTADLWTLIQHSPGSQIVVRISDGRIAQSAETATLPYRCVWPIGIGGTFSGNACHGPVGSPCFQLDGEGGLLRIDRADRPALNFNAAVRECAFFHGQLASERTFVEALRAGLDGGSGRWLHTSDRRGFDATAPDPQNRDHTVGIVAWLETALEFDDTPPNASGRGPVSLNDNHRRPFRCVGLGAPLGPNPNQIANYWSSATTYLKSTAADVGVAGYLAVLDACFEQGGHLPMFRDLMELVQDGLTAGSNSWVWTADHEGGPNVSGLKWNGVEEGFDGFWNLHAIHLNRNTETRAYRCVFYPVDPNYSGPTDCNGGCFSYLYVGSDVDVMTWADEYDRAPAPFAAAVSDCYAEGGHLATKRDLSELVRQGLPNGQFASGETPIWLWTADGTGADGAAVMRWLGAAPEFADVNPTDAQDAARTSEAALPYRCVWTNEIRYP